MITLFRYVVSNVQFILWTYGTLNGRAGSIAPHPPVVLLRGVSCVCIGERVRETFPCVECVWEVRDWWPSSSSLEM